MSERVVYVEELKRARIVSKEIMSLALLTASSSFLILEAGGRRRSWDLGASDELVPPEYFPEFSWALQNTRSQGSAN